MTRVCVYPPLARPPASRPHCSPSRNEDADPAAGPLLTFLQFAAVAVLSGVSRLRIAPGALLPSMPRRRIPLGSYWLLVVMFMVMSMLNNYAFALHISQPMHMVFRSAGLVVSFLVGKLAFDKEYTLPQFVAVVMLSTGALLATAAEALVGDTAAAAATAGCASCDDATPAGLVPPSVSLPPQTRRFTPAPAPATHATSCRDRAACATGAHVCSRASCWMAPRQVRMRQAQVTPLQAWTCSASTC